MEQLLGLVGVRAGERLDQEDRRLLPFRKEAAEELAGDLVAQRFDEDRRRRGVEREVVLRERGEARARVAEERVRFHPVPRDRQQRRGRSDARERADDAVEQFLRF